jgi:hypothetical protein
MAKETIPTPDPRRVEVGRRNRLKRKGLTAEGRKRLRQSALVHKPWQHSTGPKTAKGKARVAENGKRRQRGPLSFRELQRQLGYAERVIAQMVASRRLAIAIAGL